MAKRKPPHEEHPDERWLITYADVLTLMFVLFMVLFSISVVNTSKFELLAESLKESLNGGLPTVDGGESILPETAGVTPSPIANSSPNQVSPDIPIEGQPANLASGTPTQALESDQLESVEAQIEAKIQQAGLDDKVDTKVDERGLTVRLETDDLLFGSGDATLRPGFQRILSPIAGAVGRLPNPVRVEGHTDDRPIGTGQFPSNWELGSARSAAVVRFMEARGIPRSRLQNAGYADARPLAPNTTAAGRAQNRRVEILVLRLQGTPGEGPAQAFGGVG